MNWGSAEGDVWGDVMRCGSVGVGWVGDLPLLTISTAFLYEREDGVFVVQ